MGEVCDYPVTEKVSLHLPRERSRLRLPRRRGMPLLGASFVEERSPRRDDVHTLGRIGMASGRATAPVAASRRAEAQVPRAGQTHQRAPHRVGQPVADQQLPEPVRPLVEVWPSPGTAAPRGQRAGAAPRSSGARTAAGSTRRSRPPAPPASCASGGRRSAPCRSATSPGAAAGPRPPSGGTAACPGRASGCGRWRTPAGCSSIQSASVGEARPGGRGRSPARSCR